MLRREVGPMKRDWLSRLEGVEYFSSLSDAPPAVPTWSLGGLAAGAVRALIRSRHGYVPQFPPDAPSVPRLERPGDFFRC